MRRFSSSYSTFDDRRCRLPNRRIRPGVLALLLMVLIVFDSPAEVRLEVPDSAHQGDSVQVSVVSTIPLDRVQVRIVDPSGRSTDVHAFQLPDTPSNLQVWISLVGLPSTAEIGTSRVNVLLVEGGVSRIESRRLSVETRDFLSERIPLNSAMSSLRATDSERKRREALEMLSVVQTIHPDAVYHLGTLQIPVAGARETSFFGDRRTYLYTDGGTANAVHGGLDLAAPVGTPVRSGGSGRVMMVAERLVTGNTVVVEHLPGVFCLYYHLDTTRVRVGDPVMKGQIIGTVGTTGLVTGPHLHWEIRMGGVAVDPVKYLDAPLVDTTTVLGTIAEVLQERG